MNERRIWDALGEIDGGLIEETGKRLAEKERDRMARERRQERRRIVMRVGGMAAMAGIVIFLGASHQSMPEKISTRHWEKNLLIQRASEPEKPKERVVVAGGSPQLPEEKRVNSHDAPESQLSSQSAGDDANMQGFYEASIRRALLNHAGENVVYSPVNLYLDLGMLAEMGNGYTRQDILSAMGEDGLEDARKRCMELQSLLCWRENAFDSILGHSVWLGEGIDYARDMVSALGKIHCASVFQGAGGEERTQAAKNWLDDFLVPASGQGEGASRNGFDLLSACSFEERWSEGMGFDRRGEGEGIFYQGDGRERKVFFVRGVIQEGDVTVRKRYRFVDLGLSGGSRLSVYLPEDGGDVEEMLRRDLRDMLFASRNGANGNAGQNQVSVSLPKFQVSSNIALNDVLGGMGLQDIFQEGRADFSLLLADENAEEEEQEASPYVGEVRQSTGFVLDEDGCRTSPGQESGNAGKDGDGNRAGQEYEDGFICNRPFVFIIWSREELPVLAGMVHTFE